MTQLSALKAAGQHAHSHVCSLHNPFTTMQVRGEQFRFFAEALKSAKLKIYVPYFVQEAQASTVHPRSLHPSNRGSTSNPITGVTSAFCRGGSGMICYWTSQ